MVDIPLDLLTKVKEYEAMSPGERERLGWNDAEALIDLTDAVAEVERLRAPIDLPVEEAGPNQTKIKADIPNPLTQGGLAFDSAKPPNQAVPPYPLPKPPPVKPRRERIQEILDRGEDHFHAGIGGRIKSARRDRAHSRRLTQEGLADRVGTTSREVSFWETGRRVPSPYTLARLAAALGKTTDYLLFGE